MIQDKNNSWPEAVTWLAGDAVQCGKIREQKAKTPFSEETIAFLDAFSVLLRKNGQIRSSMPDVMSYAFWIRRANLEQMKKKYVRPGEIRIGRRVSLHFTASNMPVLFAFSITAALLAGNSCIVRLSRKDSQQEKVIIETLKDVIGQFPEWRGRIVICRYDHDRDVNDYLSQLCDVRVMWGTDDTIREIRKSPLRPDAIDLPFPNRYAAAVFDAKAVAETKELDLLIKDFYNDTYLNDQNACSSPRIIYWRGSRKETRMARERFWPFLHEYLEKAGYQIPAAVAVQKLDAALLFAARFESTEVLPGAGERTEGGSRSDNLIVRAAVEKPAEEMWEMTVPGGFFVECGGETFEGLEPVLGRACQTVCVFPAIGQELKEFVLHKQAEGADRIVPAGHALDFSLTWDGYDLIGMLSRRI